MGGPFLTVCASWLLPAGHGSHGPTMYYSPGQARPPAGRPVQGKTWKKEQTSRLVEQPEGLEPVGFCKAGYADGRAQVLPYSLCRSSLLRAAPPARTVYHGRTGLVNVRDFHSFCVSVCRGHDLSWPGSGGPGRAAYVYHFTGRWGRPSRAACRLS